MAMCTLATTCYEGQLGLETTDVSIITPLLPLVQEQACFGQALSQ